METKNILKVVAVGAAGLVIGAIGGATLFPVQNEVPVEVEKIVEKTVTVSVPVEVPVETIVERNVTVEVPVDNGNLDLVLDHIYDNDGTVDYLTDDLDDEDVNEIVDRIVFINDIKALAAQAVKDDGVDELDREVAVDNETMDEDDIERFRVNDDSDEIVIDEVDFEDSDATVLVSARFEQDDVEYLGNFEVEFKDGEVDEVRVVSVELR